MPLYVPGMPCCDMTCSEARIHPSRLLEYPRLVAVATVGVAAEAVVAPISGSASTATPVPATASLRARRAVRVRR